MAPTATASPHQVQDCRYKDAERIVRCAAWKLQPPGGAAEALSLWRCESGTKYDPPGDHVYHGPFQYLRSTFRSQYQHIPDVVRWFELKMKVHDPRSNIVTAIGWAARYGWGPWSCA
jgi:hypothetical protein